MKTCKVIVDVIHCFLHHSPIPLTTSNYLLACIIRNNKVIIPTGSDTLEPSDSVVIITTDTEVMDVSDILE